MKEIFDRVAAPAALLVVLLCLPCSWLSYVPTSRGPAIFRQMRVGKDDRRFMLLNVRTMQVDAEAGRCEVEALNVADGLLFKIPEDPGVTRVGRFLRRTRG